MTQYPPFLTRRIAPEVWRYPLEGLWDWLFAVRARMLAELFAIGLLCGLAVLAAAMLVLPAIGSQLILLSPVDPFHASDLRLLAALIVVAIIAITLRPFRLTLLLQFPATDPYLALVFHLGPPHRGGNSSAKLDLQPPTKSAGLEVYWMSSETFQKTFNFEI